MTYEYSLKSFAVYLEHSFSEQKQLGHLRIALIDRFSLNFHIFCNPYQKRKRHVFVRGKKYTSQINNKRPANN